MNTLGQHLLVEYHGCRGEFLDDDDLIERAMREAALASGATIVTAAFHRFAPQGVSGVVVVEESHLSIHTWPEHGYAAVDFYTCGDCTPQRAHDLLAAALGAERSEFMAVERGRRLEGLSMRVERHGSDRHGGEAAGGRRSKGDGSVVHRDV